MFNGNGAMVAAASAESGRRLAGLLGVVVGGLDEDGALQQHGRHATPGLVARPDLIDKRVGATAAAAAAHGAEPHN